MTRQLDDAPDLSVYIDTNVFIHARDLGDLPWRELEPDAMHIEVVVPHVVLNELDVAKVGRDARRRDRSRRALSHIDRASENPDFRVEVSAGPPRVTLRISAAGRLPWDQHPDLAPDLADDRLVLSAVTDPGSGRKLLLSHDSGPRIRARVAGLSAQPLPGTWLLPEPDDEAAQEIARLRRDLAEARATRPRITASFVQAGAKAGAYEIALLEVPALAPAHVASLTALWLEAHPKTSNATRLSDSFAHMATFRQRILDSDQRAFEENYAAFEENTGQHFATLHSTILEASRRVEICYEVENASPMTAANLVVGFQTPDGVGIFADEEEGSAYRSRVLPPVPPARPKPRAMLDLLGSRPELRAPFMPIPQRLRDPDKFYWHHRPGYHEAYAAQIVQEFRAREIWSDSYWVRVGEDAPERGALRLNISGGNLGDPVVVQAGLLMRRQMTEWLDPAVLDLLPKWLRQALPDVLAAPPDIRFPTKHT